MTSRLHLLAALLSVAALAQAAEPVVPNAGMEEGDSAPTGWTAGSGEGGTGEFAWVDTPVHGGRKAFRVKKIGSVGHTLLSGGMVSVEAGQTVQVSAWVYPSANVRRGVYFMISQYRADSDEWQLPNTFGSTTAPLLGGQWQPLTVAVSMRPGNTRLRLQCVQAFGPSDIVWDDFAVATAGAEAKPRYEPPTKEPLPDLAAAKAVVAARQRAQVLIDRSQGRPRLSLDGRPVPWAFYVSPFWNPNDAQIADFRKAGVRVYLVPLVLGWQVYGERGPWRGAGKYDFAEVDELLWRVLRVDPEGYVLFYLGCDPYRDWGADNPDEVTCDQNGLKAIGQMHPKRWGDDPKPPERFAPSLVSHKLRRDTAETLRRLAQHVEASEPGKAVIGYHVAGSNDGQWFQWVKLDPQDLHLADYCPGAQASFRDWLQRRYGNDLDSFRRAWKRPDLAFQTARVPGADRYWAGSGILDAAQQDIADATRFYSEGVAETVIELAGTLKQATPRPILCGTYYEDITCNSGNHIALGRLLDSDALDFLAGPAAYAIRMPGCSGAVRSVFASTLLHGKTFLTEQDWRSWHSSPDSPEKNFSGGRAETGAAHNAMVRRECGMMLAFGLGTWWYDMSGGWFRDDQIMGGIAEALGAFRRDLAVTAVPHADLAVIVSEEANDWIAPPQAGAYRYDGIVKQIEELNVAGVPYRLYLQSDLGRATLPPHRAYLFLNPYALSATQRQAIAELKRDGRLLAFVHAPGVVGAADPAAAIAAITGMAVERLPDRERLTTTTRPGDHELIRQLEAGLNYAGGIGGSAYAVTDPAATALGGYAETSAVAAAARDFGTWKSVFIGSPGITAEFAQRLARWAGCWWVAEPGDAVYASDQILTIHALFPGHKSLRLRQASRVTDLTSGQVIAASAATVELEMQRGETRWFWLERPAP
jgi:hypothetical protein